MDLISNLNETDKSGYKLKISMCTQCRYFPNPRFLSKSTIETVDFDITVYKTEHLSILLLSFAVSSHTCFIVSSSQLHPSVLDRMDSLDELSVCFPLGLTRATPGPEACGESSLQQQLKQMCTRHFCFCC